MRKVRIVSGTRPTGKLHIGHYVGILEHWVRLQNEGNETFFFVVDWHALTTDYANTQMIPQNTFEVIKTFLACGLDPEKSVLFVQSALKETAELTLLFSMFTSVARLERVPTYKDMKQELSDRDLSNMGFLMYPILQAADILVLLGEAVPVGEDQLSHLELSREIARRFNYLYEIDLFPEPKSLLAPVTKLLGTDGRKMSKSYRNVIEIDSSPEQLKQAILPMITDPARKRKTDPGNPEKCPVWSYHKAFQIPPDQAQWIIEGCTKAKIGCIECKKALIQNLTETLSPIWSKLSEINLRPSIIHQTIEEGNRKAKIIARQTLEKVRTAMHLMS